MPILLFARNIVKWVNQFKYNALRAKENQIQRETLNEQQDFADTKIFHRIKQQNQSPSDPTLFLTAL